MSLSHQPTNSNIMMELFETPYFIANKTLLSIIGQWPYQRSSKKRMILATLIVMAICYFTPQIRALILNADDPEVIIEAFLPAIVQIGCVIKLGTMLNNSDQIFMLFEWIKRDWNLLTNQIAEMQILQGYAANGRRFTISYAVAMYVSLTIFLITPALPMIAKFLRITNVTEPVRFPTPLDYFGLDMQAYWGYFFAHAFITSNIVITIIIAADALFFIYIQHVCAMFTVLGYQLQKVFEEPPESFHLHYSRDKDTSFNFLIQCIKRHKGAIDFARVIEAIYTWNFFSLIGLNMIVLSVGGFKTILMFERRLDEALLYGLFTLGLTGHLFLQCLSSQNLMDHSQQIRDCLFHAKWYNMSKRTQKLVILMIMRMRIPCQVTAGRFFVMSHENFSSIIKTSMSYFTVLLSMRH